MGNREKREELSQWAEAWAIAAARYVVERNRDRNSSWAYIAEDNETEAKAQYDAALLRILPDEKEPARQALHENAAPNNGLNFIKLVSAALLAFREAGEIAMRERAQAEYGYGPKAAPITAEQRQWLTDHNEIIHEPVVTSLLYDLDRMPEQIVSAKAAGEVILIVAHFEQALAAIRALQPGGKP